MNLERNKQLRWLYLALGVGLLLCLGLIYARNTLQA